MAHDHSHNSGHSHAHAHAHKGGDARAALFVSLVLNGAFLVVEAGVGFWTGSLALLSDAAHMLSDVGALILALGAAQLARAARAPERTFGLRRAETLGAFINGLALLVACGVIFWEAGGRLLEGSPPLQGLPILLVGVIGLLINLGSAWSLWSSGSQDLNVRGALIHMLADALGSVGAIVAAILALSGYPQGDVLISIGIGLLVLWGTWGLLRDSCRILLQLPPPGLDVRAVLTALREVPGVNEVHDLHVWTLDGREPTVSAHLASSVPGDLDVVRLAAVRVLEQRFHATHVTLQVERAAGDVGCGGCLGFEQEEPHHHAAHAHA